ncbi:MAG: glycosyltransferase family 39 protein [Candidatus Melainabacteria bacterium]|nr:glycosyltransferase family 39 protein [Candidatus Melainabacteria bacterium]
MQESTAPAPDINQKATSVAAIKITQGYVPWLILVAVCLGTYCNSLGSWSFIDPGETYYTEAAREMIESGEFIVPQLNYQTYYSKPILTFWLTAGSYKLFGINEFAARLPFGLLASLLVFASYYVTTVFASKRAALLAGLLVASAPLLVADSKLSCIDIAFTTFVNLSAYSFVLCVFAGKRLWWIVLWLSLALGMLTKGPAGLLLFAIGTGLYLLLAKPGWKRLAFWFASTKPNLGILLFFAAVLPWYYMVWKATKGLFLQVFFIYENLARFQGKTNLHKANLLYYLPVLAYGLAPWFLLLPQTFKLTFVQPLSKLWFGGTRLSFKSSYRPYAQDMKPKDPAQADFEALKGEYLDSDLLQNRAVFYLASWSFAVLLFFSLSKTQLDTYAMPLVAPLSVLIAVAMTRLADTSAQSQNVQDALKTAPLQPLNGDQEPTKKITKKKAKELAKAASEADLAARASDKFAFDDQAKWDRLWLIIVSWLVCFLTLGAALALPLIAFLMTGGTGQKLSLALAGAVTLLGAAAQIRELLAKRYSANLLVAALTICVLTSYVTPAAFQYFAAQKQDNMKAVASNIPDCREEIALYGAFKPSLMTYLKRPVDTMSHIDQFIVATDPLPDDGLSYGPTKSGRKQLIIGDDKHMKDFAARPELKLIEMHRAGDWAIYELTNGYAARPKSLEESFKWMLHAGQSFTSSNNFGPLTVPLGGGDPDWYRRKGAK